MKNYSLDIFQKISLEAQLIKRIGTSKLNKALPQTNPVNDYKTDSQSLKKKPSNSFRMNDQY